MNGRFILIALLFSYTYYAQENRIKQDSVIDLPQLDIYKSKILSAGHIVTDFETNDLQWTKSISLGEVINAQTSISFREFGNGLLMSISNRGLSASHTGTYWEGLPLNSSLNGQIDFNLFDAQSFDKVILRKGGGSALFGSGSIGGSIHLTKKRRYKTPIQSSVVQTVGSFGLSNSSAQVSWGNSKFYINQNLGFLTIENDFPIQTISGEERNQTNSEVRRFNSISEIGYKIKPNEELKFSFWKTNADRNLPGTISAPISLQNQTNDVTRASLIYQRKEGKSKHLLQAGYLREDFEYLLNQNFSDPSISIGSSWIGRYDYVLRYRGWNLNAGVLANFTAGDGTNFNNPSRSDWTSFVGVNKKFYQKLNSSLVIHKGVSNRYDIPFTIDFGLDYSFLSSHTIHANFTTNYRTPTFNDLYWNGFGDPGLEPENGWMSEFSYIYQNPTLWNLKIQTTGYYGFFQNWIQWLPNASGVFNPQNIFEVETYGWENEVTLNETFGKWNLKWHGAHQLTVSENRETGNQLLYVPRNRFISNLDMTYYKFGLNLHFSYTDRSFFTTDESRYINGYSLVNLSLYSDFELFSKSILFLFGIDNLFHKKYQTIRSYSMPGIQYQTTLKIKL